MSAEKCYTFFAIILIMVTSFCGCRAYQPHDYLAEYKSWEAQQKQQEQARKEAEYEKAKQQQKAREDYASSHPEVPKAVRDSIANQSIRIGMTAEQVRLSWGQPERINKTVTRNSVHEQWVYYRYYLYFEDGVLDSYQKEE